MPRPVAIRVSYRSDAAFLLRLGDAIDKDERRPELWRRQAKDLALRLVRKLLSAERSGVIPGVEQARVSCGVSASKEVRRRR